MTTREVGIQWENAALAYLQRAGLTLLLRNFHCRHGEIDLILLDSEGIVFAEVRYRATQASGDGTASVGLAKRKKLIQTAQTWLQANPRYANMPCRFDVIGCAGSTEHPQLTWTRNAFDLFDA